MVIFGHRCCMADSDVIPESLLVHGLRGSPRVVPVRLPL